MIRSRNVDPTAEFGQLVIPVNVNVPASQAAVSYGAAIIPWAHKLVSAKFYASVVTDADDSVRIDLHRAGASILGATVDPVAADTITTFTVTGSLTGAADAVYELVATTGAGDALVGTLVLVVRPLLGRERL